MNYNQALGTSFLLEIPFLEEVNYFCQTAEVPGLTMAGVDTPFKNFQGAMPSNRIDFDQLNITFLVDEQWTNWYSILEWMKRIRRGNAPLPKEMVDITLHLLNSNKNLNKQLVFRGAFPVMLGTLPLESSVVDVDPLVCSLAFRFQDYEMTKAT
ncbi:deoxynucleotide monophosphate kinase [Acidovorax phage ACP17]|uniref:Deoxynucleotide monophosphate kinase n=1 Tax=Acidovorax phage ACP17 TaxID=2010329 RepID=A0A218M2W1_9CAUD|nr:deoxynucleotide monophosphate kinase [Acidovorax phage ACP17]ASD50381.1 deoxynucleotide monophosphate kinase [Acidovorax phage ACP17]